MATAVADTTVTKENSSPLLHAVIVVVVGLIAVQLAQPQAIGRIPIQNLLKNELHIGRTGNAAFFFWIGLAWYFKPFGGIITDAFPLFGSRRRSYILGATTLAIFCWMVLYFTPHRYNALLDVSLVIDAFMVITSVVIGGYMVEVAQRTAGTGRFSSVFNIVSWGSIMISGPIGGYLASRPFTLTPAVSALIMMPLIPVTILLLREKKQQINSREMLANAGKQLKNIFSAGTMWAGAGLLALFYLAPGASTAIFYRQQDLMHLNTQAQGLLQFLGGLGSVLAAVAYGFVCKRLNLKNLLVIAVVAAIVTNLAYLGYTTLFRARFIDSLNGFGFTLAECALMDLAMRATPQGSEGLGFSLMMSVRNFALFGSDTFGSWLLDKHNIPFNTLVILNSATTLIVVPLIFVLPAVLLMRKDAEAIPAAAPRTEWRE
jgi:MFS family permease